MFFEDDSAYDESSDLSGESQEFQDEDMMKIIENINKEV